MDKKQPTGEPLESSAPLLKQQSAAVSSNHIAKSGWYVVQNFEFDVLIQ